MEPVVLCETDNSSTCYFNHTDIDTELEDTAARARERERGHKSDNPRLINYINKLPSLLGNPYSINERGVLIRLKAHSKG